MHHECPSAGEASLRSLHHASGKKCESLPSRAVYIYCSHIEPLHHPVRNAGRSLAESDHLA